MTASIDNQRIAFWDIAKFVAIFLVVWGHSLQNLTSDDHYWLTDKVSQVIISFHMPLFMLISGYFAYNSLSRAFQKVMFNKFRQLVIPSLSWFLIISAITMVVSRNFSFERISEVITSLLSSYWFLKSLFMCYLITMLGSLIAHKWRWLLLPYFAVIVIMGEQLNYVSTISMLPFFLSGLVIRKYHSQFFSNKKIVFATCLTIYCVMMLIFSSSDYNIYIHPFSFGGGV